MSYFSTEIPESPTVAMARYRRRMQLRATEMLRIIVCDPDARELPPLCWTVAPSASLVGHVHTMTDREDADWVRDTFKQWAGFFEVSPEPEYWDGEHHVLRATAQRWGYYSISLAIEARVRG